jgi:DNA-directed RNA polymerase specialized sigma24 family protein
MEYTNSQAREAIAEYIHSARDRMILEKRLIDGLTYERIAEDMEMSVRQIKNIVYKCESILFRKLH